MSDSSPSAPASPAGLGLAAFGLTTLLISMVNAGILPPKGAEVVTPLALVFGGLTQVLVGLLEFRRGDMFGATTSCSYGAFWLWWALLTLFAAEHLIDLAAAGPTIGAALLLWGVLTFGFWISTLRLQRVVFAVFLTLWLDYLLLGLGAAIGQQMLTRAGGWLGLVCGSFALYGSVGAVTNATFGRSILPLGSRPFLKPQPPTG